jgi:NitT/TauT family transport system permease protein
MSLRRSTAPPAATADAPAPGRYSMPPWRVSLPGAAPVLLSLVLLGTWELTVRVLNIKAYLLPAPSRIWEELVKEAPLLWRHTGVTFYETLLGFGVAVVVGIGLALLFVSWPPIEGAIMPLLIFSQTIPKISIAPLLLIWFGNVGPIPKAAVTFLICFFPIVIDSAIGLRSVPPEMLHLVRSMGANRWQVFTKLRVPAALPYIFSGLKVAATLAVVGAVIGEWVGADRGLGYILLRASGELQTPLGFAAIAVLTAIGIILFYATEGLERLLIPWHVSRRAPVVGMGRY